jgi:hypothetical protein
MKIHVFRSGFATFVVYESYDIF